MNESAKPNFTGMDHAALARLADTLWDQVQAMREDRDRLRLEVLNLRKLITDDWK